MSDTPTADPTPEASAPPTSAVAVAEPPAPMPVAGAASPAAPASPRERRKVAVPMWAFAALGIVVLLVGAFFVGRSTAPETSGPKTLADAVEQTASGDMEVGNFNAADLIAALQQNDDLNLGSIGGILDLLGGLNNNR